MQNWKLDDLLSQSHNSKLAEGLNLIQPRATSGSLAAYDNYEFAELDRFRQIYLLEIEDTISGTEFFPGEMMSPKKIDVGLPDDIYKLLVEYYNTAYDLSFVTIAESVNSSRSNRRIIVRPQIDQFGRVRIGAEVYGSANTPKYIRSSFILAKFVQDDDSVEVFPGQVQYFFEHEVNLPGRKQTHRLAYVRWFLPAPARFHCHINNDIKSCNIEIWTDKFYDISRDCIIPVHNILSRFIPNSFNIGRTKYMAVIPIGRHFHM